MNKNVRTRQRTYPECMRISWAPNDGSPMREGSIEDLSESGALISAPDLVAVQHGSTIRAVVEDGQPPRLGRVIRIEHARLEDEPETRIACRWISATDRHTHHVRFRGAVARRSTESS